MTKRAIQGRLAELGKWTPICPECLRQNTWMENGSGCWNCQAQDYMEGEEDEREHAETDRYSGSYLDAV